MNKEWVQQKPVCDRGSGITGLNTDYLIRLDVSEVIY